LIENSAMIDAYIEAMRACNSWNIANILAGALGGITRLSANQISRLVSIYNENGEIRGGFGFNGGKPMEYGGGLLELLNKLSPQKFYKDDDWKIKPMNIKAI